MTGQVSGPKNKRRVSCEVKLVVSLRPNSRRFVAVAATDPSLGQGPLGGSTDILQLACEPTDGQQPPQGRCQHSQDSHKRKQHYVMVMAGCPRWPKGEVQEEGSNRGRSTRPGARLVCVAPWAVNVNPLFNSGNTQHKTICLRDHRLSDYMNHRMYSQSDE